MVQAFILVSTSTLATGSISINDAGAYVYVAKGAIIARFVKDRGEINLR